MNLGPFIRAYLQRVVNERDVTALDSMVSPEFRGSGNGWPPDIAGLREFYRDQARRRPDWHIDVQETIEVGEWVAVRALAGGTIATDDLEIADVAPFEKAIEWMALFRVVSGRITETRLMSVVDLKTPER
jgi:hypothetical protein